MSAVSSLEQVAAVMSDNWFKIALMSRAVQGELKGFMAL